MLVHKTLVDSGDRVVSIVPTYSNIFQFKKYRCRCAFCSYGKNNWLPDLDELKRLVIPGTKLIALTNPNNPTGSLIDKEMLNEIADIANTADSWILCDEVYRGTDQHGSGMTASIADIYEKGISTAGMSKAYSLAGLRLGWVAAPNSVIEDVMIHRDYDTISVGMIDDYLATIALESVDRLLERSHEITRGNLSYLSHWVDGEKTFVGQAKFWHSCFNKN